MWTQIGELPGEPENDRVLVLPDQPPAETVLKLHVPDIAQKQAHGGVIVAAGLSARDTLWDNGQQVGDRVLYGQYAGVWEEWDHIVANGKDKKCQHAEWSREPSLNGFRRDGYRCDGCGAKRVIEPLLVMNVGDILINVDKADRVRSGELTVIRAATADGKTQHVYRRRDEMAAFASTLPMTTNGVAHAS